MELRVNSMMFLCFLMCLTMPVFATLDLETYTQTGNYVTPAYGHFLQGNYKYIKDGVGWMNFGNSQYEQLGYYPIFNSIDNYNLDYQMGIKSTLGGTVYICVDVSQYVTPNLNYCQAIGVVNGGALYELFGGQLDLQALISSYYTNGGVLRYYYKLIHFDSSTVYSNYYTAYWDIENMYSNYRLISLSSSNNLSDGVITLTLNSSITKELNDSGCITYDNDGSEQTLSGTLSCLLFTDSSGEKAYPYYVETFWGGFYNYSRYNLSLNSTIIKIYIAENVTSKGLYMYYNITNYNNALMLQGRYNDSDGRRDENNNPFVIHQVFSDWRWNESFANHTFGFTNANPYYRSIAHVNTGSFTWNYTFKNNLTYLKFLRNSSSGDPNMYTANLNSTYFIYFIGGYSGYLRNGSTSSSGVSWNNKNYTIISLNGNNLSAIFEGSTIKSLDYYLDSFYFNNTQFVPGGTTWFYRLFSKNNISTTNTIYTPTNTTPINISNTSITSIQFNSLTPSGTNINVIDLHVDVITNVGGTLLCTEDEYINQTVDSIIIPTDTTSTAIKTYNIILNHQITNETLFNSLSLVHYKCTFSRTDGAIYNDTIAVVIATDKLFISNINPLNYHNYATTSISASANFSYNYSTVDHPTLFGYSLFSLDCTSIYNHKCVKYTIDEVINLGTAGASFSYFGITIPLVLNPLNPTYFSSSTVITNNVQSNRCYLMGYAVNLANETIYGNFTNNLIYLNFCVDVDDNINGSGSGGKGNATPSNISGIISGLNDSFNNDINNSINSILTFASGCDPNNQSCIRLAFWSNPIMGFDYFLIKFFNAMMNVMHVNNTFIFAFDMIVILIGNYYTICILVTLIALWKLGDHIYGEKIALALGIGLFCVFSIFGWTGIPFLLIVIAGIVLIIGKAIG